MSEKRNPARAFRLSRGSISPESYANGSDGFRLTWMSIRTVTNVVQQSLIDQLRPVVSDERIGTYLTAAGFDVERALRLYIWNALIGEAFHLPIQSVEVGLRNRINALLIKLYGEEWWQEPAFLKVVGAGPEKDIELALKRIRNRRLALTTGQVVATLSFGFWAGLLHKRFNPSIWGGRLHSAFPAFPAEKSRADLAHSVKRIADFRNRVWHHEPIIKCDLLAEYSVALELLGWICPVKATWVRPHCRVPALMREKP